MELWTKACSFAEEAAKRSQSLTKEAAKRSQELTSTIRFTDIVSETAKRATEALKRADQINSLSLLDSSSSSSSSSSFSVSDKNQFVSSEELERFGVTDELREFLKEIDITTFKDFPLPDDAAVSDVPTVSNVSQDLTEWQARHATLVLSTVKEISKLRYELCPRVMKERKFWRIYFLLVNNHTAPYERKYMELKPLEQEEADEAKESIKAGPMSNPDGAEASKPLKKSTSSADQDLDAFLLGDLGEYDDGQDDGDDHFDDDFDKIGDSSEDEQAKDPKK